MAQSDQRPRHHRQPSRIPRFGNSGGDEQHPRHASGQLSNANDETIKYIKRTLCAHSLPAGALAKGIGSEIDSKPLHELLPPLTSSNDVDMQLYGIIAVILSQFVQTWYNRITPDNQFVAEIVQIIAHCTRGLEGRMRHVDLQELLLDELPAIVIAHIDGTRFRLPRGYAGFH
ncbi:hypothetical protein LTR37_001782 [Vermiconidia calcicola]|uniref:Uncharacterized protein n=1 Tax=Vermiconidia calcicola TaxID=1690605 RepID=A0ACC3NV77_9PEZI|nr:hypothetical protein LTR37_001782 [Vermiconidia calcicola]